MDVLLTRLNPRLHYFDTCSVPLCKYMHGQISDIIWFWCISTYGAAAAPRISSKNGYKHLALHVHYSESLLVQKCLGAQILTWTSEILRQKWLTWSKSMFRDSNHQAALIQILPGHCHLHLSKPNLARDNYNGTHSTHKYKLVVWSCVHTIFGCEPGHLNADLKGVVDRPGSGYLENQYIQAYSCWLPISKHILQ